MYTDYSLLTADRQLGEDATVFFNSITGYFKAPVMQKLIMAPHALRVTFTNLIRAEKKKARAGQPAAIFAKMNSLADPDIVRELFKAAAAGVDVRLFVRGICCLRPDVPGLSENVEVRSVVGRFLEHSRVYLFGAEGTEQKLFLSSADWMTRNLDHRVELLFPIEDPDVFAQIKSDINMYWSDTVKSRRLSSDGTYHRIEGEKINSQEALIDYDFELEEEEPAVYNEDKIIEHPDLEEFPDRDDIGDVLDYDDYHDISHDESLPAYENESEEDDEDEIGEAPFYNYAADSRYDYLDEEEDDDF
jgi:polyphosphate kinase